MDSSVSKWERRMFYRSLALLAKGMENELVTVDLRNETSVSGRLENVDRCLNLTFQDAAYVEYEGSYKYFPCLFIPCRMVRDIIIPSHMPISETIKSLLPRKRTPRPPLKKPLTFKKSRALKQQEETKKLVQGILKERKQTKSVASGSKTEPNEGP